MTADQIRDRLLEIVETMDRPTGRHRGATVARMIRRLIEEIDADELDLAQAADYLGVSIPWVVLRIADGELPNAAGSRHRVVYGDLRAFKAKTNAECGEALADLVRLGQEIDAAHEATSTNTPPDDDREFIHPVADQIGRHCPLDVSMKEAKSKNFKDSC